MSDLDKWNVRGPVARLRIELAEWDASREGWQAPRGFTLVRFLPSGQTAEIESRDPEGSIARSVFGYDEASRLMEIRYSIDETARQVRLFVR